MDIGIWEDVKLISLPGERKRYSGVCKYCGLYREAKLRDFYTAKKCIHSFVGIKNKRLYSIFYGMKVRCYNPDNKSYRWYGAKGIKICDEWMTYPPSFEQWAIESGYNDSLTIDRIDPNKDYCPENCRWITLSENDYYANSRFIEVDGIVKSGREWARYFGFNKNYINKRVSKNGIENVRIFIQYLLKNGVPDKEVCNNRYYDYVMGLLKL